MTPAELQAWARRAAMAAGAMFAQPAMMEEIVRLVELAQAAMPALPRNEITRTALTVLAWEQLSAAANLGAATPNPKTTTPTPP